MTKVVISSSHSKIFGHNAKMTASTKLVISTTKEEKSLTEVADFSQKVEMTGSNNVCHWYNEGGARLHHSGGPKTENESRCKNKK